MNPIRANLKCCTFSKDIEGKDIEYEDCVKIYIHACMYEYDITPAIERAMSVLFYNKNHVAFCGVMVTRSYLEEAIMAIKSDIIVATFDGPFLTYLKNNDGKGYMCAYVAISRNIGTYSRRTLKNR
jgi:hypothetical protein